ncbi:MAG: hypothetical protein ACFFAN_16705 [Promethearchaeota archaeon]
MKEVLKRIEEFIVDEEKIDTLKAQELLSNFLKEIRGLHVKDYIGDYPTFIEPIYIGNNVKIGDDVLIGPNVYIGENSEIGDYGEISNAVIFNNVKIGNNIKLDMCIVLKNTILNVNNMNFEKSIIIGQSDLKENFKKISF